MPIFFVAKESNQTKIENNGNVHIHCSCERCSTVQPEKLAHLCIMVLNFSQLFIYMRSYNLMKSEVD